jgi:hypothetical protein
MVTGDALIALVDGAVVDDRRETLLRALFPLVEFDPDISGETNDEPAWHINRRDEYFVMREDALRIVHRLREMLAAPALGDDGGLHPDAVRNYIADACVDAHLDGEDVAVDRFRSMVTAPSMDVWVAVPAPIHFQGLKLVLGRCEVVHEIPDDAIVDLTLREERDEFKAAAFITTVVNARDQQSAEMRARDHSAVQWAASHLDPDHRSAGVCATFDEVHHGDYS